MTESSTSNAYTAPIPPSEYRAWEDGFQAGRRDGYKAHERRGYEKRSAEEKAEKAAQTLEEAVKDLARRFPVKDILFALGGAHVESLAKKRLSINEG